MRRGYGRPPTLTAETGRRGTQKTGDDDGAFPGGGIRTARNLAGQSDRFVGHATARVRNAFSRFSRPIPRTPYPQNDWPIMARVNHRLREVLLGVALTALFLLGRGYVFGTRDHAIHLPYIERAIDPGFLPGDPMLEVAAHHPSFFFPTVAWLTRFASLETIYFVAYVLSVFAMLVGLRSLARHLWAGPAGEWAAAMAVAGVFVHRYVPGSIENLDAMFLPRVASLGPLLYALSLGVRRRYLAAFTLTGFVFLLHATTASHTAFVLWMGCVFAGQTRWRSYFIGPAIFLVMASPLLLMMAWQGGPGVPTPAPENWIQALKLHWPFHHFPRPWVVAHKVGPGHDCRAARHRGLEVAGRRTRPDGLSRRLAGPHRHGLVRKRHAPLARYHPPAPDRGRADPGLPGHRGAGALVVPCFPRVLARANRCGPGGGVVPDPHAFARMGGLPVRPGFLFPVGRPVSHDSGPSWTSLVAGAKPETGLRASWARAGITRHPCVWAIFWRRSWR